MDDHPQMNEMLEQAKAEHARLLEVESECHQLIRATKDRLAQAREKIVAVEKLIEVYAPAQRTSSVPQTDASAAEAAASSKGNFAETWTPERVDIVRRDWPTYRITRDIVNELNEYPGKRIFPHMVATLAATHLGVRRPLDYRARVRGTMPDNLPMWLNEARRAILMRDYPAGRDLAAVIDEMAAVVGTPIPLPATVENWATRVLGLARPKSSEQPEPQPEPEDLPAPKALVSMVEMADDEPEEVEPDLAPEPEPPPAKRDPAPQPKSRMEALMRVSHAVGLPKTKDGYVSLAAMQELTQTQPETAAVVWDDVEEWGRANKLKPDGLSKAKYLAAVNAERVKWVLPLFRIVKGNSPHPTIDKSADFQSID